MNCPRCNMILAQGAQICPNCHLNLQQFTYQQQVQYAMPPPPAASTVSRKENIYRKLLIIVVIVQMSEFLLYKIPEWLYRFWYADVFWMYTPLKWLTMLSWSGLPLIVSLVIPKGTTGRVVLIVFASIFTLWKVGGFIYDQFTYDPWGYGNPYSYFQF